MPLFVLMPLDGFGGSKTLPHTAEHPLLKEQFTTYPGLNADFKIDINENWMKLAHTPSAKDIDIQILFELNHTAANVWQSLVACNQNDPEIARKNYYDGKKNHLCSNKEQSALVYEQLRAMSENFVSFAISTRYMPWRDSTLNLPPLHPLLGQKILEIIAWNKAVLHKKSGTPPSLHFGGIELELEIMKCERKSLPLPESCAKIKGNLKPTVFGYRILRMTSTFCTNYGLWPNQSLFLFAEWNLFNQTLISTLPSEKFHRERPEFHFIFEGKDVYYMEDLEAKHPNQLPPFYRYMEIYSPEIENRIAKVILQKQKERYFVAGSNNIQCWAQKEKIISVMEQTGDYFVLNQMTRPIMEKYIRLYESYVKP